MLQLLYIFSEASSYDDDFIKHGDLNLCEIEIENWFIRWREKHNLASELPKHILDCRNDRVVHVYYSLPQNQSSVASLAASAS